MLLYLYTSLFYKSLLWIQYSPLQKLFPSSWSNFTSCKSIFATFLIKFNAVPLPITQTVSIFRLGPLFLWRLQISVFECWWLGFDFPYFVSWLTCVLFYSGTILNWFDIGRANQILGSWHAFDSLAILGNYRLRNADFLHWGRLLAAMVQESHLPLTH